MRPDRLVKMANEIAGFYELQPDRAGAPAAVAAHLKRFWTPAMRRDLVTFAQTSGAGLSPVVVDAVRALAG